MCGANQNCKGYPAKTKSYCEPGSEDWQGGEVLTPGGTKIMFAPPKTTKCPDGSTCGHVNEGHFGTFFPSEWGLCGGVTSNTGTFFNLVYEMKGWETKSDEVCFPR